ncbi:PAQR family membrane homeostasis protein TrhA [Aerococcus suis]|uniref:Hemolysin III n=1 Tax=Aerococcus suis TaxID=371602 RepID=A0A1W1Y6D0_9LACT|nr:hemolysin III family protein [Aerococcus suis]MCI7240433.1 hemolysin III family protein [Aerococcus suis]MDD7758369.1 hemolysin III family protein [Aerococcus suis]SMC31695.1 hemolysin III [Aerococcus suis]
MVNSIDGISVNHYSRKYQITNEVLNAVTHGIGTILAIIGTVLLIFKAIQNESLLEINTYIIYGASMCFLYLASTLYHSFSFTRMAPIFKVIDHSSIFLLIAGTYTPFCLLAIGGKLGWFICISQWIIALAGVFMKIFFLKETKKYSTALYILMGWLVIFAIKDVILSLGTWGSILLVLGGIFYTVGTIFYANAHKHYWHVIWHIFVILGSMAMYFSIYYFV